AAGLCLRAASTWVAGVRVERVDPREAYRFPIYPDPDGPGWRGAVGLAGAASFEAGDPWCADAGASDRDERQRGDRGRSNPAPVPTRGFQGTMAGPGPRAGRRCAEGPCEHDVPDGDREGGDRSARGA